MIIYCDDTTFYLDRDFGPEMVGIGCLIVDEDLTSVIVNQAFDSFKADPDVINSRNSKSEIATMDQDTLSRGYFHASEDSQNSHSPLTIAINEHLKGNFKYGYLSKTYKSISKLKEENLQYLAIVAATTTSPVKIFIEQCSLLSEAKVANVIGNVFKAIEWSAYKSYAIPLFFPKGEVTIVNKSNPGIQVIDFLLWANNRARLSKPDRTWLDRVHFRMKSECKVPVYDWVQGDVIFKEPVRSEWGNDFYPKQVFPLPDFNGTEHLNELFTFIIERIIPYLNMHVLPEKVAHFQGLKDQLLLTLEESKGVFTNDIVRQLVSFYLRLFDMLPIFTDKDKEDIPLMQKFLQSKRLAGLILRQDLVHGVRTTMYLSKPFRTALKLKRCDPS